MLCTICAAIIPSNPTQLNIFHHRVVPDRSNLWLSPQKTKFPFLVTIFTTTRWGIYQQKDRAISLCGLTRCDGFRTVGASPRILQELFGKECTVDNVTALYRAFLRFLQDQSSTNTSGWPPHHPWMADLFPSPMDLLSWPPTTRKVNNGAFCCVE